MNWYDAVYEGRVQRKLRAMLEALGYTKINLHPASGHYRTSKYADCYRWEGSADDKDGNRHVLYSWDPMSDCTRYGFDLDVEEGDSHWQKTVSARYPRK